MKITDSEFSSQILKSIQNSIGNVYFFNHIAVVEINEGVHFDANNSPLIIDEIVSYFGNEQPYGIVSNRVNSYSVSLVDTPIYRVNAKNLCAYGVVGHDLASKMNAEMESSFCAAKYNIYHESIYEAINTVYNRVKNSGYFSLN